MNKASRGDGIPVELFQIVKDDAVKVLHSICQQIWKTQQWPLDWKKSVFIPIPKKGNARECLNYRTIMKRCPLLLITKVMQIKTTVRYRCTVEYYSAIKKNEIMLFIKRNEIMQQHWWA